MATGALSACSLFRVRSPVGSEPFLLCTTSRRLAGPHALAHLALVALWVTSLVAAVAACGGAERRTTSARNVGEPLVDDFGDTLRLVRPASRIVSLNPVTTEALFAIGAGARLVGRTHWDTSPREALRLPDLGDGIQPNVEAVLAVHPDLVVLYAANANRAAAAAFRRAGVPSLSLRTDRIADVRRALLALGAATGDTSVARVVADSVQRSLDASRSSSLRRAPLSVFWYAWDAPVITIGAGSYLDELVQIVGARNVFGDLPQPSPQVTLESVAQRNPDVVLVGPRTAERLRHDTRWQAVPAVRAGRILVVDTALVGRPGVRMGEAARSLRALLDSAERSRP